MELQSIRLSNFQCFGSETTEIAFDDLTFLIGPNGSGKTAVMQALCRMFAYDPTLKRIYKSDFHVPHNETDQPEERTFWIEVDFIFPELADDSTDSSTIPPMFKHMRLDDGEDIPRVRYRLDASIGLDGDIEGALLYVLDLDGDGFPLNTATVPRSERINIQVHYLPARRDPADHIAFSTNALLGRLLRAVNWESESAAIKGLTDQITEKLSGNDSVSSLSTMISNTWEKLHKGSYFNKPSVTFVASEIDVLLRHLSVSFSPGHDEQFVDYSMLSDGQKSILYLSLVISSIEIGRSLLSGEEKAFDLNKFRPAIFSLVAVEEPENSLSPHFLGRIVSLLQDLVAEGNVQALVATHAPSMLHRVEPENIRYLRLVSSRQTLVTQIKMPSDDEEARKFVREAVMAFPELYFSRLVVLGEGGSEEIVLPRLLRAKGAPIDECAVSIVPLGGRHVNHFWRLLTSLEIPYLTLLDLDLARWQGGWGRIKNVNGQLKKFAPSLQLPSNFNIPAWNNKEHNVLDYSHYADALEGRGIFFASPLDLDFAMLKSFPDAFEIKEDDRTLPGKTGIKAVLGKSYSGYKQYSVAERKLFITYHKRFKLKSKPAAHINALSCLSDEELKTDMPPSLNRLCDTVMKKLKELPE